MGGGRGGGDIFRWCFTELQTAETAVCKLLSVRSQGLSFKAKHEVSATTGFDFIHVRKY